MQQPQLHNELDKDIQELTEPIEREVERTREPWLHVSKKARFFIALYLVEGFLFTILAWFVHEHPVISFDVLVTREFQENRAGWLQACMSAVSFLGSNFLVFGLLILVTALFFWFVRLRLEAIFIVALPIVSQGVNTLIKLLVDRPRPSARLVEIFQHAAGLSFPSGHVMSYVAFFGLLFSFGVILFRRDRWWHYILLIIPALFVVLVGPSRIYLGDHWASDVLGGYLLGSLLLGLSLWLYLWLKRREVLTLPIRNKQHTAHTVVTSK